MDYSDEAAVLSALEGAAQADEAGEQAGVTAAAPVAPEGQTAPVQPEVPAVPAAPVDTPPNLFEGTPVNPDTLPAELQPLAKQLQAAYTQKTQTLAEERRQFSALGSPEEVQQAVELYTRISDPTNWPQLHADLADLMEQHGLSPAEAAAEAATAIHEAAAAAPAGLDVDEDDPELGPLAKAIKAQQAEIDALRQERATDQKAQNDAAKAERLQMALEGEVTRQTNAILQANPNYGQGDMDAIYELSAFYEGNLLNAQARYEALRAEWVGRYIDQKSTAAAAQGAHPAPAAARIATTATPHDNTKDAADDIEEYMRQLQAAGELPEL